MREVTKWKHELVKCIWDLITAQVYRQRGRRCERCGVSGDKKVLTIHHKNYNPLDNRLCNLVILCQGCHFKTQVLDSQGYYNPKQLTFPFFSEHKRYPFESINE